MAITLLRHTTPDIDLGTCYGRLDIDVTDSFIDEADRTINTLSPPDRIITSPLKRCQRLAKHVATHFDLPCQVDHRLTEMDFGRWEGRLWRDIPRHEIDAWAADLLTAAPHQGESMTSLNNRVSAALTEFTAHADSVLLVTHAGVIKSACYLTGGEQDDFDWSFTIAFGEHLPLT